MPAAPQPPGAHHPLAGFDCGKPGLNEWLIRHAMRAQISASAKTYVAVQGDRIAGYFSLTVGQRAGDRGGASQAPGNVGGGSGA